MTFEEIIAIHRAESEDIATIIAKRDSNLILISECCKNLV